MQENFGKYAVLNDVEYTFEQEPEMKWTIKPITMYADAAMASFLAADRFAILPDGTRVMRPVTNQEIAMREIALTFRSSNIAFDDGKTVLPNDAAIEEVEAVLCHMPPAMVLELWKAVGQACPPWGPVEEKKAKKDNKKGDENPKN